jgi:hypothetical protein
LTEEDIVCVSEGFGCTSTGALHTMPGNIQLQQVLSHSDAWEYSVAAGGVFAGILVERERDRG